MHILNYQCKFLIAQTSYSLKTVDYYPCYIVILIGYKPLFITHLELKVFKKGIIMAGNKKKTKKGNKISFYASSAVIILIFLSVIVYNVFTLFFPLNLNTSEGEILKKEKAAYQNIKTPEFDFYFTIIDKNGKSIKYKTNEELFNLYNESDKISFKYNKNNYEIVDINK